MRQWLSIAVALVLAAGCASSTIETTTTATGVTTLAPTTTQTTTPPTTVAPSLPPPPPEGLCRSYEDPVVAGTIDNEAVVEVSGIASSRNYADVIWMHNDSRGGPFVYATTTDGESLGTFELDTLTFDWEDIAIGPGPEAGVDYLYLGDIGDNFHFRPVVTVHRIAEPYPDPPGGFIADVEVFDLVYPEPGLNAEAMFVDPVTGRLIIVTKPDGGGSAEIFTAPAEAMVDGATVPLLPIGRFDLPGGLFVTAADIHPAGAAILFRGYNEVWLWERTDIDLVETFAGEPCDVPSTAEIQGEAITFARDGYSYYTVSEGSMPDVNYVFSIFD